MQTVAIASQKGGSGKTTLARNISVAAVEDHWRTLCIDLDPQGSLRGWWTARVSEQPVLLDRDPEPAALVPTLTAAAPQFDLCVIDTPPAAGSWLTTVLEAVDLLLVPVRPSPDDLRAVGATVGAANQGNANFVFVMSQTPARARLTDATARALAQHGRVAPVNVGLRVAYAETAATGQGVIETANRQATQEMRDLWNYLKGLLDG